MHGINYVPFNDAPTTHIHHPCLLPKAQSNKPHIVHQVTNTDTLPRLALKYGVSVGAIRHMNRLSSDEIWFRKTLMIPTPSPPPSSTVDTREPSPPDKLGDETLQRQEAVEKHQRTLFLAKLTDLEMDLCRQIVNHCDTDMTKAVRISEWIQEGVRDSSVNTSATELLAYLIMYDFDVERAEDAFARDVQWEQIRGTKPGHFTSESPSIIELWERGKSSLGLPRQGYEFRRLPSDASDELIEVMNRRGCGRGLKNRRAGVPHHDEPVVYGRRKVIELEEKKNR
eukprot:Protomagalhaensia_wolfi_Nauph_80__847@NODE_148_length_3420_cov_16_707187_g110_i0_p3_GENE_NODE_148_length_3420_cov_16_707187_g110_i0NODE_148_length_3420_cov_16_707187_g110_i0_p3_ORF_typecomplete_len283_score27_66LysM/PF01476_20/3_6e05_NODE_148_length_3420_cov_16_707187_g110_i025103358